MTKGKLSQLKSAYQRLFPRRSFDEKKAIAMVEEVVYLQDKYPFEDDGLRSKRLVTITSIEDTTKITEYLASIPADKFTFHQTTCYGRVLEIHEYHKNYKSDPSPVEEEETTEIPVTAEEIKSLEESQTNSDSNVDSALSSNGNSEMKEDSYPTTPITSPEPEQRANDDYNKNTQIKEEVKMENTNAIDTLRNTAANMGVGTNLNGSNVSQASKADLAAATKIVQETKDDRQSYSKNAEIEKVLVTAIDREEKATQGRSSMGRVSDPQKAMKKFREVSGFEMKDGVIEFTKRAPSETHDNMMKVYNILEEACKDPNFEVKPYFGKEGQETPITIKAFVVKDPAGKKSNVLNNEIAELLLNHTFMYLNIAGNARGQVQLDTAKPRAGKAPTKGYVVRIANRKETLSDASVVTPVKELTKEPADQKTGFKSEISVSCLGSKTDAKGEPRKITWRIPLEVEQYKVIIVDEFKDLFKSTGVGHSVAPINPDDAESVADIMKRIQGILAAELTVDAKSSIMSPSLTAAVNSAKEEAMTEAGKGVEDMLGGNENSADFD